MCRIIGKGPPDCNNSRIGSIGAVVVFVLFAWTSWLSLLGQTAGQDSLKSCLPAEFSLDEPAPVPGEGSVPPATPATLRDRLAALHARCVEGKLRDGKGREIVLYRLAGCWGNRPAEYREILEQQKTELT